jgi:dihydrofolate reductase
MTFRQRELSSEKRSAEMTLTLNMTTSLNGIAARENDSTDIFQRGEWAMFMDMARETGAMIWGRRTHEVVRGYGEQALAAFDGLYRIVVSHDASLHLETGWNVATSPQAAVAQLKAAGHEQALLGGGGTLNTSFVQDGLVDEIVIFMESVVVGKGIPVFSTDVLDLRLDLVDLTRVDNELAQLRYTVRRDA